jgi:hypothetical protein
MEDLPVNKTERHLMNEKEFIDMVLAPDLEEKELMEAEVQDIELLKSRSENQVFVVKFKNGKKAIFKPKSGETAGLVKGIKAGTYANREVAARTVDKFLFNKVPPTVLRDFGDGHGEGSLQLFVDAKLGIETSAEQDITFKSEFIKMAMFDYIIYNADRQWNNYMVNSNELIYIDNSLSGRGYLKLVTPEDMLSDKNLVLGQPVPEDAMLRLNSIARPRVTEALAVNLFKAISEEEGDACIQRIFYLKKMIRENNGRIPLDLARFPSFVDKS